jgi:hypothetical protein
MATYRAAINGNWNNLSTWEDNSSGNFIASTVLPGTNDDVYLNGKIVNINQDINIKLLSNSSSTNIMAGGRFELSSSYNITTLNGIIGQNTNASNLITDSVVYIIGTVNITINSNITGGSGIGRSGVTVGDAGINSIIIVNGNISTGSNSASLGFWANPKITLTVNGNVTSTGGGGTTNSNAIRLSGIDSNLTINGNITAGAGSVSTAVQVLQAGNGTINITGDLIGGTGNSGGINGTSNALSIINSTGIINIIGNILPSTSNSINSNTVSFGPGNPTCTIIGNINGGAGAQANGLNIASTNSGTFIITGNIIGQTGAAINNLSLTSNIILTGNVYASSNANGIIHQNLLTFTGTATNNSDRMAIMVSRMNYNTTPSSFWSFQKSDNTPITLYPPGANLDNPSETDVRSGVTYASGLLTGSLAVPPTGSVALGVPVDSGVGTAMISVQDMGTLLASYVV